MLLNRTVYFYLVRRSLKTGTALSCISNSGSLFFSKCETKLSNSGTSLFSVRVGP
jgi:hypothetical protein